MDDKFFETVEDRFNYHATPIKDNIRGLEWLASDYFGHLGDEFKGNIDKLKDLLDEMEEAVRALKGR